MTRQLCALSRFVIAAANSRSNCYEACASRYFIRHLKAHSKDKAACRKAVHQFAEEFGF